MVILGFLLARFEGLKSNQNYGMLIIIALAIAAIVVLVKLIQYLQKRFHIGDYDHSKINKHTFSNIGKEIGLSHEEINILFKIVSHHFIKTGYTCFNNPKVLDEVLKKGLYIFDHDKNLSDEEKDAYRFYIFEIKRKIEEKSRKNQGINSTNLISEQQKIIIYYKELGYFYATVLQNLHRGLYVKLLSDKIKRTIFHQGEFIRVYFWRENDSGYIFNSEILDTGNTPQEYIIAHSSSLKRSQKRKYKRTSVNLVGEYFQIYEKVVNGKKRYEVHKNEGHSCVIFNLSAGGLKMETKSHESKGELVRVEFSLLGEKITVYGKIVRLHEYKDGRSEISVQFTRISTHEQNSINQHVYNYTDEYL